MATTFQRGRHIWTVPEMLKDPMTALAMSMDSLCRLRENETKSLMAQNVPADKVLKMVEETHAEIMRLSQNIPTKRE